MSKKRYIFLWMILPLMGSGQAGTFGWAFDCGNPPNTTDGKTTLATTSTGELIMGGEFLDTADFGDISLASSGGTDVFLVKYDASGESVWAQRMGGTDYDFIQRIDVDAQGNILVCGYFYGTIQIGDDSYASLGSQDLFLARYDAQGNLQWSAHAGGPMADYIAAVTSGQDGEVVIAGYFYQELGVGDTTLFATAGSDVFVSRFQPDGVFIGAMAIGGSSSDQVRSVSVDQQGSILIAGSFYDDMTIGDTTLTTSQPVGVYLAKFHPDFQPAWVQQLNGTYLSAEVYSLFDHEGNFYLTGNFSDEIFFSDKPFVAGEFNQDLYVARYTGEGELLWARHGHSDASDQVIGLGIDPDDNLYVAGHYLDTIQFDDLVLHYSLCCGSREVFVVNYREDGNVNWGQQVSGARANVQSISVSGNGRLFLSGLYSEDLFFGPYTLSYFDGFRNYYTSILTEVYTGIAENTRSGSLLVFPNPARERITIKGKRGEDFSQVMVFDLAGKIQMAGEPGKQHILDLAGLVPGKYVVVAVEKYSGKIFQQVFLKF